MIDKILTLSFKFEFDFDIMNKLIKFLEMSTYVEITKLHNIL